MNYVADYIQDGGKINESSLSSVIRSTIILKNEKDIQKFLENEDADLTQIVLIVMPNSPRVDFKGVAQKNQFTEVYNVYSQTDLTRAPYLNQYLLRALANDDRGISPLDYFQFENMYELGDFLQIIGFIPKKMSEDELIKTLSEKYSLQDLQRFYDHGENAHRFSYSLAGTNLHMKLGNTVRDFRDMKKKLKGWKPLKP